MQSLHDDGYNSSDSYLLRMPGILLLASILVKASCSHLNMYLWRYRYRLYRTDQHCTGTDNYRYSNGQRFRVYWLYWADKWLYIQDR